MTDMKLAYFVSRFPHLYQTFVRREIDELVRQGAEIDVFPVAGRRRGGRNDKIDAQLDASVRIVHTSLCNLSTWLAASRAFGRNFKKCTSLSRQLVIATRGRPADLVKSLAAFVKGLVWSVTVAQRGYTHIHAHWSTYPATAALTASELTGTPFSFAFHAYDIFATRIMISEKIERAAFAVVNCRYTLDYILRNVPNVDPDKLVLVYNGLDLPKYEGLPRNPDALQPVILAVGQLVPTKGFACLVDACALLGAGRRDFRLIFAGSGPMKDSLAKRARKSGISDLVEFAGEKTEAQIRHLLASAAMLVMPCVSPGKGTHDALPNVVVEALASGVPVVATDVFGIPEVVKHGETGLLVPERDAVALKAAIARILTEPELATRFATQGRRRAAALFDAKRNGKKLLELFRSKH